MVGQMNELELAQVESHMSLVHGIALQLTQIANKAEQAILIVDLKKIRVKTFSNKMVNTALKKIIGLSLQYFPDFLYKGFIVNAPMSFSQVWDSYSTLLPPATLAKIRVIGGPSDPEITSLVLFPQQFLNRYHQQCSQRLWVEAGTLRRNVLRKTSLAMERSQKKLKERTTRPSFLSSSK
eukprot:TRINITY_DN2554_c0_g1_i1.p3 TRINITY_DN2554_c0_g1~~TRINITY_DN2554_c0_g1_i1.p3  ORF type:complete len:180 (-),score=10.72 TRINITY_DN2554_c0_g1_i1:979-1518(-)